MSKIRGDIEMQRLIKFRAWNTKAQQLRARGDSNPYTLSVGFIYDSNAGKSLFFELAHKGEMLVQQYTGLKDKNGVEIYEGDILRSPSMPDSPVEYQRGSFNGVYADGSHDEWEAPLWRYTVEVIGNIYENSELLGENQ